MTINSQYEGKCKGFKNPDGTLTVHTWDVGSQIHYQKMPKCICINEACFNQQKAGAGTPAQSPPVGSPSLKTRTESEKTEDNVHMLDINWTIAEAKAIRVIPKQDMGEDFGNNQQRVILAEVFYKSLVSNWLKP